ncbi:MAG: protein kinase, partial [Myxococcaceae bacterium]|nr:protein kinase [Myxococcaceae bacterium]
MQTPACPNDDALRRYVEGQLVETERATLNAHVSTCDSCQSLVVSLGRGAANVELPPNIEEFEVLQRLGKGAMGEVYLARDTRLQRLVALKLLVAHGDESRERLMREARAAARVHHPNLAAVYRVAEHQGRLYLVSEYLDGQTLADLALPLPPERALAIATDLARGLAAAHLESLVHRDIKPQNAMLTKSGTAKLVDFGLAKAAGADPQRAVPDGADVDLTRTGALVGTPRYMAPELWRGEAATPHTDVYAFGVMLYELLGGRPPHHAPSVSDLRDVVLTKPAPPLAGLMPSLPPALCELVDRCLRLAPGARFASGAELLAALEALGARPPALHARVASPPPPRRRLPLAAASAALLVAGAVVFLWLPLRDERPSARSHVGDAAQAYDEGLAWWRSGSTTPAVRRFEAAVASDPSFAAAQLWLAFIHPDAVKARAAYSQAVLHKQQLGAAD